MESRDILEELTEAARMFFSSHGRALDEAVAAVSDRLKAGGKILVFGNGGSAAEAQHFAAELVNRFLRDRPAIPAVALTTDTSCLTAIGNDASFDLVFRRQVEALGNKGDVALALSTSGNSRNVIEALKAAKERGMLTVALTGDGGGRLAALPDYLLPVPSRSTPRVQEVHLLLLHVLAEEVEKRF